MLKFLSSASLLSAAAAASVSYCPTISDATLPGVDTAGERQLLAGVKFPVTLTQTWAATNSSWCGSGTPPGVTLSNFELVVEGASATKVSIKAAETTFDVEFPEGGSETTLMMKLRDTTGLCGETQTSVQRYVFEKNTPLAPLFIVFLACIITRDVYFSLGFAGVIGWMILQRNFWFGLLRYFDTGLPDQIAGGFRHIMLFLFLMGGVVGASVRAGGVQGLGETIVKFIKDSFWGQAMVYILGWTIFLDDYATTIIAGTTLRPVTDTMRISREKLSFLVDCTASPIAGVMPLSTWIAHELSVLKGALAEANYTAESTYIVFLNSLPYCFYSWYMLMLVAADFLSGRDWAFMYWAEKRARETGEVAVGVAIKDGSAEQPEAAEKATEEEKKEKPKEEEKEKEAEAEQLEFALVKKPGIPARWWNSVCPYAALVCAFVILLFYSGATNGTPDGGVGWDAPVKDIVGNANSWAVLQWTAGMTITVQIALYGLQYNKAWGGCLLWPREVIDAGIAGSKEYFSGALALMLAFNFAKTLQDLQIAQYLVQSLSDSISPTELPTITFLLCAIFALATGTSWGTMTVFFPICIPLALAVAERDGSDTSTLLAACTASVLQGAIWGDHCSPVSDTTILSAAASSVPLLDHTKTQLPYATLAGLLAIIFGYLPAGAGAPPGVSVLLGFIFVPLTHIGLSYIPRFGGPVAVYDPAKGEQLGAGMPGTVAAVKANCPCRRRAKAAESDGGFEI